MGSKLPAWVLYTLPFKCWEKWGMLLQYVIGNNKIDEINPGGKPYLADNK